MIHWLLGLLGLGGVGAFLFFVPGAAAKALELLKGLLDIVLAHPREVIIAILLVFVVREHNGKNAAIDEADKWHSRTQLAEKAFNDQKTAYINAQAEAAKKEQAQRLEIANLTTELARKDQERSSRYEAIGMSAADKYARAHGVRCGPAAPQGTAGGPEGAIAPGVSGDPTGEAGPGGTAGMVAVSRPDYDKLVKAALRAADDQVMFTGWVNAGLAVPSQ